jgi:hypothetical protein
LLRVEQLAIYSKKGAQLPAVHHVPRPTDEPDEEEPIPVLSPREFAAMSMVA